MIMNANKEMRCESESKTQSKLTIGRKTRNCIMYFNDWIAFVFMV